MQGGDAVLRLLCFRPAGAPAVLDASLRHDVVPNLLSRRDLVVALVGRRGEGRSEERIIASVWRSADAMRADVGDGPGELADVDRTPIEDPTLQVLPLAVSLAFDGPPAAILRVFRGECQDSDLQRYLDQVRRGVLADASAEIGPAALLLGLESPSRFVTVSLWRDWPHIEAATGSSIQQPVYAMNDDLVVSGTALHYELLPDAAQAGIGAIELLRAVVA